MITTDFGDMISARVRTENETLAARWFERLIDLLPVDARKVFPSSNLLDHVPALILEIGACLHSEHDGAIAANSAVLQKARELGALRHGQRASLHQVLREYQILGGVLVQFVLEEIGGLAVSPPAPACVETVARIHQAVDVLAQTTVESFVALYTQTIAEQTERLEEFTRMATHEWRQPLGALQFGVSVLQQNGPDAQAQRTLRVLERNVTHLIELTRKLESVARIHGESDSMVTQLVPVNTVAREAARQLREMAEMRDVDIRIDEPLPELTVDVGRLELTFVNLLSNAIKYSDPAKPERYIHVTASLDGAACRIEVRDNGIGIPADAVAKIFQRFTRVHGALDPALHVNGVGLGLSIVDDCVHAMGGQIHVESVEGAGAAFIVSLPLSALPANP
ncbi:MAG TPA: HAMP domain-containing sensor histidine kinase [Vicinamibacterales bacterium]|nr:HAMP domain-containing sensor histidine kinase [Vicinamibacterales bacterium]